MSSLLELLKDIPTTAVLRERVMLVEERYRQQTDEVTTLKADNGQLSNRVAALETENANLRKQVSGAARQEPVLSDDTVRVLVALFEAAGLDDNGTHYLGRELQMSQSVLQYHLDELEKHGLASCGSFNGLTGDAYWGLTPAGRARVVRRGLAA